MPGTSSGRRLPAPLEPSSPGPPSALPRGRPGRPFLPPLFPFPPFAGPCVLCPGPPPPGFLPPGHCRPPTCGEEAPARLPRGASCRRPSRKAPRRRGAPRGGTTLRSVPGAPEALPWAGRIPRELRAGGGKGRGGCRSAGERKSRLWILVEAEPKADCCAPSSGNFPPEGWYRRRAWRRSRCLSACGSSRLSSEGNLENTTYICAFT